MNLTILKRRSVIAAIAVLVVVLVTLLIIPVIIESQARHWLTEQGNDSVTIQDIDFNPFTGVLLLHELEAERDSERSLHIEKLGIEFVWHELFGRKLVIQSLSLSGMKLLVQVEGNALNHVGGVELAGFAAAEADEGTSEEQPWGFAIDRFALNGIDLTLVDGDHQSLLTIGSLQIEDLASFNPDQLASLELQSELDGARIQLDGRMKVFSDTKLFTGDVVVEVLDLARYSRYLPESITALKGRLAINNSLELGYAPEAGYTLKSAGKLNLSQLSLNTPSQAADMAGVSWSGDVSVKSDRQQSTQTISLDGSLQLLDAGIKLDEDINVSSGSLGWAGKTVINLLEAGMLKLNMSGKLASTDTGFSSTTLALSGGYKQLDVQTEVLFDNSDKAKKIFPDASANISVDQVTLAGHPEQDELVRLDHVEISQLAVNRQGSITATSMATDNIHVLPAKDGSLLVLGKLSLVNTGFSESVGVAIDDMQLQDVATTIRRDGKGNLNIQQQISDWLEKHEAASQPSSKSNNETPPGSDGVALSIGNIELTGENNIVFEDHQVEPAFKQAISVKSAKLSGLDNSKPSESSPFSLQAVLGKRSTLDIAGKVAPFAGKHTMDMQVELKGYSLPPLSAYSIGMLGHTLNSGSIDVSTNYQAKAGVLDIMNNLELYQVEVSKISEEEYAKLKSKPDVPLETGLSMLRDKNNTIRIKLPIKGDIDNLKVDPADVINQALGKALKKAAKSYVAVALFPYGTLLTIVELAGDKGMQIKLDPVVFAPGSAELDDKQTDYLKKVADILQERPEMRAKVCAYASGSDRQWLITQVKPRAEGKPSTTTEAKGTIDDGQLLALAESRTDRVELLLINQYQVKSESLVDCKARIDSEAEGKPRVELSL